MNIIVHTLQEVNQTLSRGEYFWVDIARDGIALYELPGSALATPKPLTAADAYGMTSAYFTDWLSKVDTALEGAAFTLHQVTERAYICEVVSLERLETLRTDAGL